MNRWHTIIAILYAVCIFDLIFSLAISRAEWGVGGVSIETSSSVGHFAVDPEVLNRILETEMPLRVSIIISP